MIHFASLKSVGESVAKPIEYYDNNLNSTIVLLKAMRAHDVKKVIFSSSATVYGTPKELPLTEESQIGGTTNPYGTTKFFEEQILRDVHVADDSWTVVILRYFNRSAPTSPPDRRGSEGHPANLTPYIAKVALGELKEVQVFGDDYDTPDGTACATTSTLSIWPRPRRRHRQGRGPRRVHLQPGYRSRILGT